MEPAKPLPWFWAIVAVLLAAPLLTYVPKTRQSFNQGLASLQRTDIRIVTDPVTRDRKEWALRLASPEDGGKDLAKRLGVPMDSPQNPVPDFRKRPDPFSAAPSVP